MAVDVVAVIWFVPMLLTLASFNLGSAYWVHGDARRRGSGRADAWAIGVALFGLVGLAYYLLARRSLEAPSEEPTRADRVARSVAVAALLTSVVVALGPPDPYTQGYVAALTLPFTVAVAVLYTYRDVLSSAV